MTDKQVLFCNEYMKDFNGTQAAIRAGYSSKTAYSIGHENLNKPEIKKVIETKKMEICNQNNLSIASLIADVALIKDKCIHEVFDASNALKACDLLSKFLVQHELRARDFLSKIPDKELDVPIRSNCCMHMCTA